MRLRIRSLIRKEFRQLRRDRRSMRLFLFAPVMQLFLFGYAVSTDLRNVKLRPGTITKVSAKLGFGQVRVIVPRGVRVIAAPGTDVPDLLTSATRNGATTKTSGPGSTRSRFSKAFVVTPTS